MATLFPQAVDLERNAAVLEAEFPVTPTPEQILWATTMVPVHGTSLLAAQQIIEAGEIRTYDQLDLTLDPEKPSPHLTDELDIVLDQHKYSFFNIGKTDSLEVAPVYFCVQPSLVQSERSFVAMRDIARLGALVSPEARELYKVFKPEVDVDDRNAKATEHFFGSLVKGSVFGDIFARFIATHYPAISEDIAYWRDVTYPEEALEATHVGPELHVNAWPGPQLQVLGAVSLQEVCAVVLTDPDITELPGIERFEHISVAHAQHWAEHYKESMGVYTSGDELTQRFNRSFYANLVLRDITLTLLDV